MFYSQDQIDRANHVDLADFLKYMGEEIIRSGSEYRWKKHDSVTLRGNTYYQHSAANGGHPVDFVRKFYHVPFPEAVHMLIQEDPECPGDPSEKQFSPPLRSESHDDLMRYLSQDRGLSRALILRFLSWNLIYEEAGTHNVVFVGYDPNGSARYAHKRGTRGSFRIDHPGSDKSYSFSYRGGNEELFVFEAPIDLLSFINLYPEGYKEKNYLSLGGVAPKALLQFLQDQPNIKRIHLCLDADKAGEDACQRLAERIPDGIMAERYRPIKKDWNEVLLHRQELEGRELFKTVLLSSHQSPNVSALQSMTMEELFETSFPPKSALIEGLLFSGTYIFAGAPKVGKSFLMLQFAYHVATGTPLWGFSVMQAGVLYLALEDNYSRLQERLYRMFGVETTSAMHLVINANTLADGLVDQIEGYIRNHTDIRLVIIDTLQKVRDGGGEGYSYANDYESITKLKKYSDRNGICILVVHHTRKMESPDPYERISGTNGLLGAADGGFILSKDQRNRETATLEVVGRDQEELTITLRKDRETLVWCMESLDADPYQPPLDPLIIAIARFMNGREQWTGIASELLSQLPEVDLAANTLIRKLNVLSGELYNLFGISYIQNRRTSDRKTFLLITDKEKQKHLYRNDDMTINDGISDTGQDDDISSRTPV